MAPSASRGAVAALIYLVAILALTFLVMGRAVEGRAGPGAPPEEGLREPEYSNASHPLSNLSLASLFPTGGSLGLGGDLGLEGGSLFFWGDPAVFGLDLFGVGGLGLSPSGGLFAGAGAGSLGLGETIGTVAGLAEMSRLFQFSGLGVF